MQQPPLRPDAPQTLRIHNLFERTPQRAARGSRLAGIFGRMSRPVKNALRPDTRPDGPDIPISRSGRSGPWRAVSGSKSRCTHFSEFPEFESPDEVRSMSCLRYINSSTIPAQRFQAQERHVFFRFGSDNVRTCPDRSASAFTGIASFRYI